MADDLSRRLYVANVGKWKEFLNRKRASDAELEIKIIEHGIILPTRKDKDNVRRGGVCDSDFNFVAGYKRNLNGTGGFNCVESSYTVEREKIVQLDEDVIYGGLLAEHFGHFLTESLCRLWYVIQHPELKSKILFLTVRGVSSFLNKILGLIGIDKERIIYVNKPIQCRSITVPEQAQYDWLRITKEWFIPYQVINDRIKASGEHKKLYLTRTTFEAEKARNMTCFNENYFEDFFVARGFEKIAMEKLSLEEQIALIKSADEVAATLGTLTHWAMFCKPGTKFIMINRTDNFVLNIQCWINMNFDVDWYLVDGSKNLLYADRTHGACILGSNKYWRAFVKNYFGEQVDEDEADTYFAEAFNRYLNFWSKKYADSKETLLDTIKNLSYRNIALEKMIKKNRPLLNYQTHVGQKGWVAWSSENQISNDLEQNLNIQAIRIYFPRHNVYYSVYFNAKEGWSTEVSNGEQAGTTGKDKSLKGIKIRLDEEGARRFDIFYRIHKFDGTWTAWAKNGAELFSDEQKINAVQIRLEDKSFDKAIVR